MTVRAKVIAGLVLLAIFWAAAAVPAVADAVQAMSARLNAGHLGGPAGTLVLALETERRLSAVPAPDRQDLLAQRIRTDLAARELRTARGGWTRWLGGSDATRAADGLLARTETLSTVRASVDAGHLSKVKAADAYTAMIDPDATVTPTVYPDQLDGPAGALSALSRSRELLAEEDAYLAAGARPAALAGARRILYVSGGGDLDSPAYTRLTGLEGDLLAGRTPDGPAWSAAFNEVNGALWDEQTARADRASAGATSHAVLGVVRAGVIGGLGLVALIAAVVLSLRTGRGPATRPARATTADTRAAGPAPLDPLLRDLERRSEGLLHRQLRLLDGLARRESDEETLGEVFRADQLASRIRRNLEKAITLAGGTPGRRWSHPVPLTEVVRGAAAEIADYQRVSTSEIEAARLAGDAVTDLMHLLAELIENAATFSPAETRIRVTGARQSDGYRITVTDVGSGMTEDDLATAAAVMADATPPTGGTWWGLYAVGRFADRHAIAVTLHNGVDGGLAARVTVPADLIGDDYPTHDDQPTMDDLRPVTS